jgi:hypothetical protein
MGGDSPQFTPKQTLILILAPMLATFGGLRVFLHFVRVQHVYPGGYLVHHLFTGALVVIPAAFLLAFGPRSHRSGALARVAVGIGSAMILDELVFLVMTKASDADYVSPLSLWGGAGFVFAGVVLLLALYRST